HKIGVLGKLVTMTTKLRDGDRVEIYRPLPKKVRDAHAVDDRKARIQAKKERKAGSLDKDGS
ncbi:MAG: RnfH family protein, partial [Mariprofundaceae bacterium]|nr:RnfH family protein [Mariprofundaceae bacterium]